MKDNIQDAEKERIEKDRKYKHKMQINRNLVAGVIMKELIRLILETISEIQKKIMNSIMDENKQNLLPDQYKSSNLIQSISFENL